MSAERVARVGLQRLCGVFRAESSVFHADSSVLQADSGQGREHAPCVRMLPHARCELDHALPPTTRHPQPRVRHPRPPNPCAVCVPVPRRYVWDPRLRKFQPAGEAGEGGVGALREEDMVFAGDDDVAAQPTYQRPPRVRAVGRWCVEWVLLVVLVSV